MRIANSNISMSSSREFSQGVRVTSRNRLLSVSANSSSPQARNREKNTTFEFSGKSFSEGRRFNSYTNDGRKQSYTSSGYSIEHQAIKAKLKIIEKEEKAKEEVNKLGEGLGGLSLESIKKSLMDDIKEEEAKLIKKIVEAIKKFMDELQGKKSNIKENNKDNEIMSLSEILKRYSVEDKNLLSSSSSATSSFSINRIEAVYEETMSYVETEVTSFEAQGSVMSADGRKIDFKMEMGMSRAYAEVQGTRRYSEFNFKDPLVVNLEGDAKDITTEKYDFDIDGDGEKDKISFAGRGSGFLALDKNGDGKINDGTELFGTRSGDGFSDLAAYDDDGNGWIDENDKIFMKLLVWSKDKDGNDELVPIAKKGIGAIYLGRANTEFSIKDMDNNTQAVVRKTGIFLKESGEAGSIKQIDLAV